MSVEELYFDWFDGNDLPLARARQRVLPSRG